MCSSSTPNDAALDERYRRRRQRRRPSGAAASRRVQHVAVTFTPARATAKAAARASGAASVNAATIALAAVFRHARQRPMRRIALGSERASRRSVQGCEMFSRVGRRVRAARHRSAVIRLDLGNDRRRLHLRPDAGLRSASAASTRADGPHPTLPREASRRVGKNRCLTSVVKLGVIFLWRISWTYRCALPSHRSSSCCGNGGCGGNYHKPGEVALRAACASLTPRRSSVLAGLVNKRLVNCARYCALSGADEATVTRLPAGSTGIGDPSSSTRPIMAARSSCSPLSVRRRATAAPQRRPTRGRAAVSKPARRSGVL